jgi:HK97 family phage major capsid protein
MNAARKIFPNEAAARRAGIFLCATAGIEWAVRRNERDGFPLVKALAEGVGTSGGFLVPPELSDRIIELRDLRGVFRQNAYIEPMGSDSISVPRRVSGLTAFFTAENATITESQGSWDSISLTAKKLSVLARASAEVTEDSAGRLAAAIVRETAYQFADREDQCGFVGDGGSSFGGVRGLTKLIVDGGHNASKVTAASGHDLYSEIDATDLANVIGAVPNYALANARWYVSPMAFALVFCRLATSSGGIIMMMIDGRLTPTFLGFPIVVSSTLPNVNTTLNGVVMILLGDLNLSSTIGDRTGVQIKTNTQRALDADQILFRGRQRFDLVNNDVGDNTNPGPMVGLTGN